MARIILSIIFLVVIAILIVMNVGAVATVNVFGWQVEELPVTAVAIVCFVAGVLYSFIFYLMSYLERGRRERLARRKQKLKEQETQLKSREQQVDELAEESRRQIENAKAAGSPPREEQSMLSGLFGRRRGKAEARNRPPDEGKSAGLAKEE